MVKSGIYALKGYTAVGGVMTSSKRGPHNTSNAYVMTTHYDCAAFAIRRRTLCGGEWDTSRAFESKKRTTISGMGRLSPNATAAACNLLYASYRMVASGLAYTSVLVDRAIVVILYCLVLLRASRCTRELMLVQLLAFRMVTESSARRYRHSEINEMKFPR